MIAEPVRIRRMPLLVAFVAWSGSFGCCWAGEADHTLTVVAATTIQDQGNAALQLLRLDLQSGLKQQMAPLLPPLETATAATIVKAGRCAGNTGVIKASLVHCRADAS